MMLLFFCCSVVCFAVIYSRGDSRIGTVLAGTVVLIMLTYVIHAFTALIRIDGNTIQTRSFFIKRSVKLPDIEDVTKIKLKGRYIFFLISMESYVVISSLFDNFLSLKKQLNENMQPDSCKVLNSVSDEDIAKSIRNRNVALIVIFAIFVFVTYYIYSK